MAGELNRLAFSVALNDNFNMSYTGTVHDGVIVLPPDVKLPEGSQVKIEPLDLVPEDDPFIQAILKIAKPRPHWPKDYALNHGHYVSGEPRKS